MPQDKDKRPARRSGVVSGNSTYVLTRAQKNAVRYILKSNNLTKGAIKMALSITCDHCGEEATSMNYRVSILSTKHGVLEMGKSSKLLDCHLCQKCHDSFKAIICDFDRRTQVED